MTTAILCFLMGSAFVLTGLFQNDEPSLFPIVMGGLFIVWSIFSLRRALGIQRAMAPGKTREA